MYSYDLNMYIYIYIILYIYDGVIGRLYKWRLIIEISLINLDGFMMVSDKSKNKYIMGHLMGYIYIYIHIMEFMRYSAWLMD